MGEEERLVVRLPVEYLRLLSELVYLKKFNSESEAVLAAVKALIDSQFTPEEKSEILNHAESHKSYNLNDFVAGDADASKVLSEVIARGLESERNNRS